MPTLRKKIIKQKKLGNSYKVNSLQKQLKPKGWKPSGGLDDNRFTGNATGSTSEQSARGQNAPAAPAAPPAQSAPPSSSGGSGMESYLNVSSYNPASGQPDPRDSEYWANLAALQATTQQDYAKEQLAQSAADTEYGQRLTQAGETRRRDVRGIAENLIGTGLLRSGAHNRRQTEATIDYTNQLAGWGQEKSSSDAMRKAQMQAILANLGFNENQYYWDAVDRYSTGQAERAAQEQALAEAVGVRGTGVPGTVDYLNFGKKKRKKKK